LSSEKKLTFRVDKFKPRLIHFYTHKNTHPIY
ncbi:MAG: hypothetical protein ACI952_001324, partial [Flavobacteriales bacterium]